MRLADHANADVAEAAPWVKAKLEGDEAKQELHMDCSAALEMFRLLSLYLKPVLPKLVGEVEKFFNIAPLTWASVDKSFITGHQINNYEHLITRIDPKAIEVHD